jgi:hypothetical protein
MNHTRHRSVAMVRVYTRRADAFADHAGGGRGCSKLFASAAEPTPSH